MRSMITPIVALIGFAATARPVEAQIPWNNDLQAAHAQAKQEGKRLLMHFYTDNCVFCDRLESGAFQSPELAAAIAKDFVPVKIHAAMNARLAKTFRVTRFPTDVIVSTDGTVLSHGVSPQDPNRFVSLLSQHAPQTRPQATLAQSEASRTNASAAAPQGAVPPQTPSTLSVSAPGASYPQVNPYGPPAVAGEPGSQLPNRDTVSAPMNVGGPSASVAAYRPQRNPTAGAEGDRPSAETAAFGFPAPPQATNGLEAESNQVSIAPGLEAGLTNQTASAAGASTESQKPANREPSRADDPAQAKTPPVALQGFCPVALVEKEAWIAGDPAYGAIHLGQLYLFTDQDSLETFRANPEPYTPVMNGNDVVLFFEERRVVEGRRDWGLWDPEFNRIFLFATEETMNHFFVHHQDYVRSAITVTHQAAAEANSKRR